MLPKVTNLHLEQGTPEWHEWRGKGIGATDASAIVGASKWGTALSVYTKKLGLEPPMEPTKYLEWGTRIEPLLGQKFMEMNAGHCQAFVPGELYERDWRHASLDGECLWHDGDEPERKVIIECKTASSDDDWFKEDGTETVPAGYYAQVQWQMWVSGYRTAFFSVLVSGVDWFQRRVEFDANFCDILEQQCSDLWNCVLTKTPPQNLSEHLSSVDLQALAKIVAKEKSEVTLKTGDIEVSDEDVQMYRKLKNEAELAVEALDAFKARMALKLKNGGRLTAGGRVFASIVTRKGSATIDAKKLRENYPEIAEACTKTGKDSSYFKFA